ncbi:MAG: hypothetical protein KAJ49_10565, partial [Arcobacteraceae bacterium]|nr:hypothetical protein [Arcobacteraceae bacterium]
KAKGTSATDILTATFNMTKTLVASKVNLILSEELKSTVALTTTENNVTTTGTDMIDFAAITAAMSAAGVSNDVSESDLQTASVEGLVELAKVNNVDVNLTEVLLANTDEAAKEALESDIKAAETRATNLANAKIAAKAGVIDYITENYESGVTNISQIITATENNVTAIIAENNISDETDTENILLSIMEEAKTYIISQDSTRLALKSSIIATNEANALQRAEDLVTSNYIVGVSDVNDCNITIPAYTYDIASSYKFATSLAADINTSLLFKATNKAKSFIETLEAAFTTAINNIIASTTGTSGLKASMDATIVAANAIFDKNQTKDMAYQRVMASDRLKTIVSSETNATLLTDAQTAASGIITSNITTYEPIRDANIISVILTALKADTDIMALGDTTAAYDSVIATAVEAADVNITAENNIFTENVNKAIRALRSAVIAIDDNSTNWVYTDTYLASQFAGAQLAYAEDKAEENTLLQSTISAKVAAIIAYEEDRIATIALANENAKLAAKNKDTLNIFNNKVTIGDTNVTIASDGTFGTVTHAKLSNASSLDSYYGVAFGVCNILDNVSSDYNTSLTTSPVPWTNIENGKTKYVDITLDIKDNTVCSAQNLNVKLTNVTIFRDGVIGSYDGNYTISTKSATMSAIASTSSSTEEYTTGDIAGDNFGESSITSTGSNFVFSIANMVNSLSNDSNFANKIDDIKTQFTQAGDYNVTLTIKGLDGMNELIADENGEIKITGNVKIQ